MNNDKNNNILSQHLNFEVFSTNTEYKDLNTADIPEMYMRLIDAICKDYDNINELNIKNGKFYITSSTKEDSIINEFEALITIYSSEETISVRNIKIKNERVGKMTELFNILEEYVPKFDFDTIEIENVQSEAMECWCKKNKFIQKDKLSYIKKYPKFNLPELD